MKRKATIPTEDQEAKDKITTLERHVEELEQQIAELEMERDFPDDNNDPVKLRGKIYRRDCKIKALRAHLQQAKDDDKSAKEQIAELKKELEKTQKTVQVWKSKYYDLQKEYITYQSDAGKYSCERDDEVAEIQKQLQAVQNDLKNYEAMHADKVLVVKAERKLSDLQVHHIHLRKNYTTLYNNYLVLHKQNETLRRSNAQLKNNKLPDRPKLTTAQKCTQARAQLRKLIRILFNDFGKIRTSKNATITDEELDKILTCLKNDKTLTINFPGQVITCEKFKEILRKMKEQ